MIGHVRFKDEVQENTNNSGSLAQNQEPIRTDTDHQSLRIEEQSDFRKHATPNHQITENRFVELEEIGEVDGVIVSVDGTDDTGGEDGAQENEEVSIGNEASDAVAFGGDLLVQLGGFLDGAVMLVGLDLQVIGNTVQEGADEGEHRSDSRIVHDKEILPVHFVELVDEVGGDVVGDGTADLLAAVVIFTGRGVGLEDAQDDGVDHGEGAGGEEALPGSQENVVGELGVFGLENGESHGANKECIDDDTPSRDQLVLAGLVRPVPPKHGAHKVEHLKEECDIELTHVEAPESLDELEDEGVGRVDQPIKEEVQHLRDHEVGVLVDVATLTFACCCSHDLLEMGEGCGGV